jgi:multidrug efflux pump subunit AcrB
MVLIFVIGGLIGLSNIGRLEDPAFTIKQVLVTTQFAGASAEKVENEITEPLEIAIQQMPQLLRITSVSKPGISEITAEVQPSFDTNELPQIWDELRKRIRDTKSQLPIGAGDPQVFDDFGDVFGLYYALSATDFSPRELREFARIIRRELLATQGVAKVQVSGVKQEQLVAFINPYQIAGLGISFPDLTQLLESKLRPFANGRVQIDGKNVRLIVDSSIDTIEEIYNLVIVLPGTNRSINVRDVAELRFEPVDIQPVIIRYQGNDAITLAISALNNVNIVEVGQLVRTKVDELLTTLPAGITLTPIYDQAEMVDQSVQGFIDNLIMSISVVAITLMIAMGWRSGIVVGSVLLFSVIGTVLLMWLQGLQLQRISLGAMVIAMGMLVDNAIVVAEGMMLRMQQGKSALQAASFIVKRTQWPLLGATIIGIAAFSGIGLSDDATGEFLYSLYVVVLISLMLSWVMAITVVPILGSYLYKVGQSSEKAQHTNAFYSAYKKILVAALKFRWLSLSALLAITVTAYAGFGLVKQGFFPSSNTPIFFINYWGPQDRDIRKTDRIAKQAEQVIMGFDNVKAVTSFVGRGPDRFTLVLPVENPNESLGSFVIEVNDRDKIEPMREALLAKLKALDLDGSFYMTRIQFGPSNGAKVAARFSGPDAAVLRDLAEQAKQLMIEDGKLIDIRHNWREKGIALNSNFNEFNAGVAGVSVSDFSQAIQYASDGLALGQLRDGDYTYSIKAKMADNGESTMEAIENAQVWSSQQRQYVPLRQLSDSLALVSEDTLIHRRNRLKTITVFGEPALDETAAKAHARISPVIDAMPLPDGYKLEWGGEFESANDAQEKLGQALPAGFLVMFLVSVLLFGSVRQPLIIWLVVPMAVVGVVSGLLLTDMPFGFMSLLGFLSLFGMLIKNAIVLLEEIDLQIKEGKPPKDAIVSASTSRLRPVVLAAITTILGMAPLLTDAFFADMSVTIMGGLSFATILTLIAVPVLYSIFFKISFRA